MPGSKEVRLTVVCSTSRCEKCLNLDNYSIFAWTATQGGEKGGGPGFQAGGPTGPYPVGEVGQRTPQEQLSIPRSPTQQGS